MPRGIVIEIIGDETSYLRAAEGAMAANTKLDASFKSVAVSAARSADAQIAAAVKSQEAMRANVAALQARAAALPAGSAEQKAAMALAIQQQARLDRALGLTTASTVRFGAGAKTAERDLNKMSRGVLAGSGLLGRMGKSLAFASSGFIAFAVGASVVASSIKDAESLAKAQESLNVAIGHTGGNLAELQPRYEAVAKAAARFGVDQITATTGLARATLLTGNAAAAQRAYQEALVISKATGKDFNVALTATAKAQAGITTSLRRYGILVTPTMKGTEQFALVMKRFGGQAGANTTQMEKLHAAFTNTLTTIGEQLLPTFNRLAGGLADWLTKMNESGKLQKDVASGMKLIHDVTSPLITTIKQLAGAVQLLNQGWKDFSDIANSIPGLGGGGGPLDRLGSFLESSAKSGIKQTFFPLSPLTDAFGPKPTPPPMTLVLPSRFFPELRISGPALFGGAKPMKQFWQKFELTFKEQLAQVQASLTRSTADDVAAAREIVARVKRAIDRGTVHGAALIAALGLEAQALSTIWAAEDAAAQKRAARAQAAKERIQKQIEAAIDPIRLEIQLAKAELSGSTPAVIHALKALRAAAKKMLDSGKLSAQQQLEALQQIISLNQQIKDATSKTLVQFQVPAKLALRLARDQALGRDTTKDLLAIRKALLHFIHTHRKNIAALTDAYNQLAAINEQLTSSISGAFGAFKKASVKALTAGLNLTAEQRRELEQRLSQRGPGGTVPGQGVGAAGFIIGPDGRPIRPGRGQTISASGGQAVTGARFDKLLRVLEQLAHRPVHVVVDLDGTVVSDTTTRHQQRHRRRNPSSRRGPYAGTATA